MDSIFDYLIILFVLYGLLEGVLGKKRQKKQPVPQPDQRRETGSSDTNEMSGIEVPYDSDFSTTYESKDNYDRENSFETSGDEFAAPVKSMEKTDSKFSKYSASFIPLGTRAHASEIVDNSQLIASDHNSARSNLLKLLSNKESIGALIVAQEIIGKPKSLRR